MDLSHLFGGTYVGRRVLVTGHTGFKGSWLTLWLHAMGASVTGIALEPDTQPSHWRLLGLDAIRDLRVDINDAAALRAAITSADPEIVFHLAAQPLVQRGYARPEQTFATNVMGLVNLLEALRTCTSVQAVVNATTDKVYAGLEEERGYRETDPLGSHDPYSSSKACAELVSDCYRKSFFEADGAREPRVRLATARAGNVIGGGDWAEDRLVPDLVRAAVSGQPLKIRNPMATRPWQHVLEPLSGYLRLGLALWNDARFATAWNFGPGSNGEVTVESLALRLRVHWPILSIERDGRSYPRETAILRLNCDKVRQELSWRPVWNLDTTLARTAAWYRNFHESGFVGSMDDLSAYIADAHRSRLEWAT